MMTSRQRYDEVTITSYDDDVIYLYVVMASSTTKSRLPPCTANCDLFLFEFEFEFTKAFTFELIEDRVYHKIIRILPPSSGADIFSASVALQGLLTFFLLLLLCKAYSVSKLKDGDRLLSKANSGSLIFRVRVRQYDRV